MVNRAHARFIDARMEQIVLNGPVLLISAAEWFCTRPPSIYDKVKKAVVELSHNGLAVLVRHPPNHSKTLASVLAFYFTRAVDGGCAVSKVFSFPRKPPVWAN